MAGLFPNIETAGNCETFVQSFGLTDPETGEAIDLADVSAITFKIRDPDSRATMLSASIGNGITLEADDEGAVFTVRFESASMQGLCAKTYDVVCVITRLGDDTELFGNLPVVS
jgi:hypothetical protein